MVVLIVKSLEVVLFLRIADLRRADSAVKGEWSQVEVVLRHRRSQVAADVETNVVAVRKLRRINNTLFSVAAATETNKSTNTNKASCAHDSVSNFS